MALQRTIASAGLLVYAPRLADAQTSASSGCEFLTVTGGVSPGSYSRMALQSEDGRSVYAQTGSSDEIAAVLLFAQSSVMGRRLLASDEGLWSPSAIANGTAGFHGEGHDRQGPYSPAAGEPLAEKPGRQRHPQHQHGRAGHGGDSRGLEAAAPRRTRSLAGCAGGFWINKSGDSGVLDESAFGGSSSSYSSSSAAAAAAAAASSSVDGALYPVYAVPDCADHPADISTGWFSVGCATCELEAASPSVEIECDDQDGEATATPAPTVTYDTPAPTVTYDTPAPTVIYDTPGPSSDEGVTPRPVETTTPTTAATATPLVSSSTVTSSPVDSDLLLPEAPGTLAPSYSNGGESATPGGGGGGDDDVVGGGNTLAPESVGAEADNAEGEEGSGAAAKAGRVFPLAGGFLLLSSLLLPLLPW